MLGTEQENCKFFLDKKNTYIELKKQSKTAADAATVLLELKELVCNKEEKFVCCPNTN